MNEFLLKKSSYYYRKQLTAEEQKCYQMCLERILNHDDFLEYETGMNGEQIKKITDYICFDRPDVFWFNGNIKWHYHKENSRVFRIEFVYVYNKIATLRMVEEIKRSPRYKGMLRAVACETDVFRKHLVAYEYIIKNCEYDTLGLAAKERNPQIYNIYGIFVYGKAVCAGYTKAYQYVMSRYECWATYVGASTKRGSHAYNLVSIGGEYCYVDATWGDPVFAGGSKKEPGYISYDYFGMSTAMLNKSHNAVPRYNVPLCTSLKYNYYRYYNLCESVYTCEGFAEILIKNLKCGKMCFSVVYENSMQYEKAYSDLFEHGAIKKVFDYVRACIPLLKQKTISYGYKGYTEFGRIEFSVKF